jgi:hypothetical protein
MTHTARQFYHVSPKRVDRKRNRLKEKRRETAPRVKDLGLVVAGASRFVRPYRAALRGPCWPPRLRSSFEERGYPLFCAILAATIAGV